MLDLIESRSKQTTMDWNPVKDVSANTHQPYQMAGRFVDKSFLLDNRIRDRQVGYEVLSVFELLSGEWVLVNRGWIKGDKYRQTLPKISFTDELAVLEGYFYLPEGAIPVLKQTPVESGWPKRIQQVEWGVIENSLNAKFITQSEFRLADDNQAGSYRTGWPKAAIMPEKHLGYAYQWFALSVALTLLTVIATIKIKKNQN